MTRIPLDLIEDVHPATDLESQAEDLVQQVLDTRRPVVLTRGGERAAVLVDVDSYESLLEEIELLRDVHRGLADVEAGNVVPHDEARARLMARYE